MNAPITQKQAQHIVNILEYVSKSTSKSTIAAMTNALLELGVLKEIDAINFTGFYQFRVYLMIGSLFLSAIRISFWSHVVLLSVV